MNPNIITFHHKQNTLKVNFKVSWLSFIVLSLYTFPKASNNLLQFPVKYVTINGPNFSYIYITSICNFSFTDLTYNLNNECTL